ncbi:succinate semialdehyde dehydrogenase [Artemisia annua]|uniref:Succinate semialdehyde dehydrogenase n=1 Tax=Artemisia annua TaxID=35608 RepID=A0A2U1LYE8_ARTAN|nr:succinate semialdehyde dehydrogenase [Artemisia annua]
MDVFVYMEDEDVFMCVYSCLRPASQCGIGSKFVVHDNMVQVRSEVQRGFMIYNNVYSHCMVGTEEQQFSSSYTEVLNAYSKAVQNLKVGNGLSEGVTQEPLINDAAVQKVELFLSHSIISQAKLILRSMESKQTEEEACETSAAGGSKRKNVETYDSDIAKNSKLQVYQVCNPSEGYESMYSFFKGEGARNSKRKTEEQRPKEHKPKANENKPVMNE